MGCAFGLRLRASPSGFAFGLRLRARPKPRLDSEPMGDARGRSRIPHKTPTADRGRSYGKKWPCGVLERFLLHLLCLPSSAKFAWGQRRCARDPAFTSPKEPCSQRASRSGTVLSTRSVDDCGRPRRSNCSCDPFGGRALPCLRAARRRCFDEHDDPAADSALRADGTRDFKK